MTPEERAALESLSFDWAQVPDDVWRSSPFHVDELHADVMGSVAFGIRSAASSPDGSPIGVAIHGQRGAGKTHLLGMVRQEVQRQDGYFFLVSLHDGGHFWESVAQSLLEGLLRETDSGQTQLWHFLHRLATRVGLLESVRAAVTGAAPLTVRELTSLVGALRRYDRQVGMDCQDTLRALVLYGADDFALQDTGHQYLLSEPEAEPAERSSWGIRRSEKPPQLVVKDVSRLLALTGPSVIAVDQIDSLLAQSARALAGGADETGQSSLLAQIAGGLMDLREVTRRTLTVVACLPESWIYIKDYAVDTVTDRFREELQLHRITDPAVGRALIEKRFASRFADIDFQPPHPTWPVAAVAFDDAVGFTPRGLLQRVDTHVRACLDADQITLLTALDDAVPTPAGAPAYPTNGGDLAMWDARFEELRKTADVAGALAPDREDEMMPGLLQAGLTAWVAERGEQAGQFSVEPLPSRKPALHARLCRSLDEQTEAQRHWSFRAIASGNAIAVQARLRNACTMAGLWQHGSDRALVLLRNTGWPGGEKTRQLLGDFTAAGGVTAPISEDDLRTFAALRELLRAPDGNLQAWLVQRQPASSTALFTAVLADEHPPVNTAAVNETDAPTPRVIRPREPAETAETAEAITVGHAYDTGRAVRVPLEALRKHVAVFAGSGSGKTVLIRRLVEECALQGVSAIVLDPNNDLARLGDPWPQEPSQWAAGDADRAREYLAHTDVVVWTPGRDAGRPLTFQPLPDFAGVRDDRDEFRMAVDAAAAALAPRAKVDGDTSKALQGQAVLREALDYFARAGGSDLHAFLELLAQLPDGVSGLDRAERIASDMAQNLTAGTVIDPLFGGDGTPADPGMLLTPAPGKRARISVVSLVGLPGDGQRQSFVNQLQLALFAWVKRNPAGDRPLGGLLVMDEAQTFAPSGAMTPCTQSTLALASQARKFGLGLVFATQAPKALHNRIPGNAATQFFGFLNAPSQIAAAQEVARAKGSAVLDISRLGAGQFYVAAEGAGFVKVRTPLCLSHHPRSPLTVEEVLTRAHRDRLSRVPPPPGSRRGAAALG